jgi:hypothetical protein
LASSLFGGREGIERSSDTVIGQDNQQGGIEIGGGSECRVLYSVLGRPGQAVYSIVRATTSRKGQISLGIASKIGVVVQVF